MRTGVEREWPWIVSLVLALAGWASGVWFWGTPESGFAVIDQWFPPLEAGVLSVPLMVIAGFVLGGRRWRVGAWTVWGLASLATAYIGNFSHFGGFCIDPGEDTCVVSWLSRLAAAAVLATAVTLGWGVHRVRLAHRQA